MKALARMPNGGVPATYLNSQQTPAEKRLVYRELSSKEPSCKILFVTPEQLVKSQTLVEILQGLAGRGRLSALVVDEVGSSPSVNVASYC